MQRFLCIDGVEVSNPDRTIAYLKRLGSHMLANPGRFATGDCGCPAFLPEDSGSVEWAEGVHTYTLCWHSGGASQTTTENDLPAGATWVDPVADPDEWEIVAFDGLPVCATQWSEGASITLDGNPTEGMFGITGGDGTSLSGRAFKGTFSALPPGVHTVVVELTNGTTGLVYGRATWEIDTAAGTVTFQSFEHTASMGPGPGTTEGTLPIADNYAYGLVQAAMLGQPLETVWLVQVTDNGDGSLDFSIGANLARSSTDCGECDATTEYEFTLYPPIEQVFNDNAGLGRLASMTPDDTGSGVFPLTFTLDVPAPGETTYMIVGFNDSDAPGVAASFVIVAISGDEVAPYEGHVATCLNGFWVGGTMPVSVGVPYVVSFGGGPSYSLALTPEPGAFVTPAADDAPWYDPSRPESAEVLGVWIDTWDLSNPLSRKKDDRTWGSSLGSAKYVGRELVISGVVFATSCKATDYAKNWLYEALSGGCVGGPCGMPDALVHTVCPDDAEDTTTLRYLKRIGLISYDPKEPDDDFPCCWGFRFEATLATETPFLYHEPVTVLSGPVVPEGQESVCNLCTPCPQMPAVDPLVCGCANVAVRVVPQPDPDDCWCNPVTINRVTAEMDAPGLWTDGTAIIKITAGFDTPDPSWPGIRNLRIRAWQNPVGLPAPSLGGIDGFNCVDPCMEIDVSCIPRGCTLTIDGTTRTATLSNNGGSVNGYPYLSSGAGSRKFEWPEVSCYGLMIAVDSDALEGHTAPDSTIEIQMVGLDRG